LQPAVSQKDLDASKNKQKYTIKKELGKGGFGAVYLAEGDATKLEYAIKKVDITSMDHFERMDAKNEAAIMQKFDHPNIVKCHEIY